MHTTSSTSGQNYVGALSSALQALAYSIQRYAGLKLTRKLFFLLFSCLSVVVSAQTPQITVRFGNIQHDCISGEYCLDVEFQSDIPDQEIFGMNVRFFYDNEILELIDFRDFQGGYGLLNNIPPTVSQSLPGIGYNLFGFGGPGTGVADLVNGSIQLNDESQTPIYISTTGWTKIYQICFSIDDPGVDLFNFCPPVVWNLEQNPANGGFLGGDDGVVITVVDESTGLSAPSFEQVIQFNWEYVGSGSAPYGQPVELECISISCAPVITCPVNLTIECDDSTLPSNTGFATAIYNCPSNEVITYTDIFIDGLCGMSAILQRTWSTTDSCGNQVSCLQEITIDRKGSICGSVYNDLGQPIAGVEIHLLADLNSNLMVDGGDTLVAITFSNAINGVYCFSQQEPCSYIVVEIQPTNHGNTSDYDITPDPDGDDSMDGPDNEIPVNLAPCEIDSNNNFLDIICPSILPVIPMDTICENGTVEFSTDDQNLGLLNYTWDFGSGSTPAAGVGLGPHSISYITTTENQANGAIIELTISKDGCPDLTGPVSQVEINAFPESSINGSTAVGCYYADRTFQPVQPEIPGATYQWYFGAAAVPPTATGYGPHSVYYTASGGKTVKLVIHPNESGAQCPDSSTINFIIINCPAQILGRVMSDLDEPIQSVNVRLYADADTNGIADTTIAVKSVFTSPIGEYSMANIIPGNYVIIQTQPSGWFSVTDYDDSDDGDVVANIDVFDNLIPVFLPPSEVDSFNIFIETASSGSISGAVFTDNDADLLPDPGEGLPNVEIKLFGDVDANGVADTSFPISTQSTNVDGNYTFPGVPIGHYVLVETQPVGYLSNRDFDSSNDGDVVINTNIHNDTIPVTILNGETDANNYFIDSIACSLLVTSIADDGTGTIRDILDCAQDGDTILFHPSLSGLTIEITSTILQINKDVVIYSTLSPRLTISSAIVGLFEIQDDAVVEFRDLNIISGLSPGNMGAAFLNLGVLKLNGVNVFRNINFPSGQYLIRNEQSSELFILGACFIQMD